MGWLSFDSCKWLFYQESTTAGSVGQFQASPFPMGLDLFWNRVCHSNCTVCDVWNSHPEISWPLAPSVSDRDGGHEFHGDRLWSNGCSFPGLGFNLCVCDAIVQPDDWLLCRLGNDSGLHPHSHVERYLPGF